MTLPRSRPALVVAIVACAMFMENLDSTVISTALPAMARSFATQPLNLSFGITAYLVSLAVFIPVSGWFADRFGGRTVFAAAIAVFTVSSILCGCCQNLPEFVIARFLQGFGGALMVPVGRLVLLRTVDKAQLVGTFAYVTLPSIMAPLMGAPIGGFITTYGSWRTIFFINVPIGLVGIVLALRFIPQMSERVRQPLDWQGLLLLGGSVTALIFGLEMSARADSANWLNLVLLGAGIGLGWLTLRHTRRHPFPLVDFSLLGIPTYAASVVSGAFYRVAVGAMPLVLPLALQLGLGMTALSAGILTLSSALGGLLMKATAGPVLRRFGFRNVLIGNGIVSGLSMLLCAFIRPGLPIGLIVAVLVAGGFFRSLQFTALMAIAWADIPPEKHSAATSLFGLLQQISFSGGIAFGALLLHLATLWTGSRTLSPADFQFGFAGIGLLALINAASFIRLKPQAGAEISGHAPEDAVATAGAE